MVVEASCSVPATGEMSPTYGVAVDVGTIESGKLII